MVAYGSQLLKNCKKNYPTYDMELVAVVLTLKAWHHYLYGEQFEVFSDHKCLHIVGPNMRHHGWIEYLEDYDFTLHYNPSKANKVFWVIWCLGLSY